MRKTYWIWVVVFAVCVGVGSAVVRLRDRGLVLAQGAYGETKAVWKGEWITGAGAPDRDEAVLHFRKVIELPQRAVHFVVQVSADNQFLFYVNGKRVGTGPARSDLSHWRYETYDLGPLLKPGKNVLAATVWNFGVNGAVAQMTDRLGFLVNGNGDAERAADTNASWEVERERGLETFAADSEGEYFAAGPGERWDAAKFDWSWNAETAGKGTWTKAVTLGRAALRGDADASTNWQLVADPLPGMEMKPVSSGKVVRATGISAPAGFPEKSFVVPAHTKASVLLDRGELVTAYPDLTVSGGTGSKIRLTYSEALYDAKGGKGNRNEIEGKTIKGLSDDFLPNGGAAVEFLPVQWRTWRYLQLDVQTAGQAVTIQGFKTWFTAFPFQESAYFRSDDDSLKPIWEIGWRTARLDAHDTYMDTPYWERLQYIGDTRIQALITYAVTGDFRLPEEAMEAFNNSRVPEGLTQSRYPSSLRQMIPTFSLLWVGMVHDFWRYRGDAAFVKGQLPGTRTVLDWYLRRQRADGLLGRIEWWPFVDWGKDFDFGVPKQEPDGGSAVITLQFIEALRYAAELEAEYGDAHVAETYRAAADRAAAGIYKTCWNAQYGLLADTPAQNHFSQHANILGVWLDVIPAERQKETLEKILSTTDAGFTASGPVPPMTAATYYFRFYLARAVVHAGMGDDYLRLLGPWRQMVSLGLSTWAESPEPTRSDSHAWSAHPNYDLLTVVAGVQPASEGFATVRIEPHLGALHHVEARVPTPQGMIEVKYTVTEQGLTADLALPGTISGKLAWGGKEVALHAGGQRVQVGK
ncbi:MAG: alpha-L-rhamnosidase C-terminal domain-containing protein [Candidatus Acidiferrum sp.]